MAQWLYDNGIVAFVLEYSHGGWASFAFHIGTPRRIFPPRFSDLCKAINHIRNDAEAYGIDAEKIGVMGFSAGGYLVMHAAEQLAGNKDSLLQPPFFVTALYPVVSMPHLCTHNRSRRGLLGERLSKDMMDSLVRKTCSPKLSLGIPNKLRR